MPRASFSHNAPLTKPATDVWVALQDAATWSGIGPVDDVWDATHDTDGLLEGFSWSAHVGPTKYKGSAKVTVAAEPHHMKLHLDSSELSGALIADIDVDGDTRGVIKRGHGFDVLSNHRRGNRARPPPAGRGVCDIPER